MVERLIPRTPIWMACENIRFSSLFVAGDVSTKSEEKRMFSQATIKRSGVQALPSAFFWHKKLYSTLSLFTQVYIWVPATYHLGVTPRWTSIPSRGAAILRGLLHVKETGISSGRLSLWLLCAFFSLFSSLRLDEMKGLTGGWKPGKVGGRRGTGRGRGKDEI